MTLDKAEQNLSLERLHTDIDQCLVCRMHVPELKKPTGMRRGEIGQIFIIGIAPGNNEAATSTAFSGQSGKKLDTWLIKSGAKTNNPRQGIYLTSVLKCQDSPGKFHVMARQCRKFLNQQLQIIHPKLIITLGELPYNELRLLDIPYSTALCKLQSSQDHCLLTQEGFHYDLMAWPHPSGLNRQLNDLAIIQRLNASFEAVKPYLI